MRADPRTYAQASFALLTVASVAVAGEQITAIGIKSSFCQCRLSIEHNWLGYARRPFMLQTPSATMGSARTKTSGRRRSAGGQIASRQSGGEASAEFNTVRCMKEPATTGNVSLGTACPRCPRCLEVMRARPRRRREKKDRGWTTTFTQWADIIGRGRGQSLSQPPGPRPPPPPPQGGPGGPRP